jgi:GNAT superfamily N-acetyltransferase
MNKTDLIKKIAGDANLTQKDAEALISLDIEHDKYYASSPLFMPVFDITKLSDSEINNTSDTLTLLALDAGKPVATMYITKGDDNFIDEDEKTLHLKGAYMLKEARGTGLGAAMLQYIDKWLKDNGYERCCVDYESMNRSGGRFWGKHFTPYAYSMFRKLDERIVWANADRFNSINF